VVHLAAVVDHGPTTQPGSGFFHVGANSFAMMLRIYLYKKDQNHRE
jgi:hypothetical protein